MEADEGGRVWGDEGEAGVQEGLPFELLACGFFSSPDCGFLLGEADVVGVSKRTPTAQFAYLARRPSLMSRPGIGCGRRRSR